MQRATVVRLFLLMAVIAAGPVPSAGSEVLIVSAAASLTDAFSDIEPAFEKSRPGADVIMNFAASGTLYRQIVQGAPADVFASASADWMNRAVADRLVLREAVVDFAANTLVLAAPADNPASLSSLSDLSGDTVTRIAIGAPETVPAGQYAKASLEAARLYPALSPKLITCEHVRQVLDYLSRGEVDGGFVYRTDAVRAGRQVRIITELAPVQPITYPIAPLAATRQTILAREFVAFVAGGPGLALIKRRGFQKPVAAENRP